MDSDFEEDDNNSRSYVEDEGAEDLDVRKDEDVEEIDAPKDEDAEEEEEAICNEENCDEAPYQEHNDHRQQQQQQQEQVKGRLLPAAKKRNKKDLNNLQGTKLLKLIASSRQVTNTVKAGQDIARSQFQEERKQASEKESIRPVTERSNKRQRYSLSNDMTAPVGYSATDVGKENQVNAFEMRMEKAAQNEIFDIERKVTMKANRFMPFGTSGFFLRTNDFYSEPTDLVCIWCTEPFNTPPIPSPVKYKPRKTIDDQPVFMVQGQFCSFNCLLAHHRKERPSLSMARHMMKLVYGIPMSQCVQEAPMPTALKKFGGIYSIDEFRATSASGIRTEQVKLPFFPFLSGITEVESIETIIREQGGKELAIRRLRGSALGNITPVISTINSGDNNTSSTRRLQKGRFATSLSIKEQIDLSDRRYRLQRQDVEEENNKKRMTLVHFMRKKNNTNT